MTSLSTTTNNYLGIYSSSKKQEYLFIEETIQDFTTSSRLRCRCLFFYTKTCHIISVPVKIFYIDDNNQDTLRTDPNIDLLIFRKIEIPSEIIQMILSRDEENRTIGLTLLETYNNG